MIPRSFKNPRHVAIIMDGNGRWAKARNKPRIEGHRQGAKAVQKTIQAAIDNHIEVLTLWAFGKENWSRPKSEIDFLFKLMLDALNKIMKRLKESDLQFRVMGDLSGLPKSLQKRIHEAETISKDHAGLKVVIALNYSGRWDIVQAVRNIAQEAIDGIVSPSDIDEKLFEKYLMLSDLPEPDLLIRTSGELRISNFYLWQLAFTEMVFTDIYWPDFDESCFKAALEDYQKRCRRFGGLENK